jgi:pimeloyl-ACP methyl ester carboxylesterase
MAERVAVFPPAKSGLGFKSWARELAAASFVTLFPQPLPQENLPRGDGRPVLLIPGFLSGDWSLIRLRAFLSGLGYCPATARLPFNPGPTAGVRRRLDQVLQQLAKDRTVSLVGVSLGGVLARDLARRHSEAVHSVVTLCSPVRFPVMTPLSPFARLLSRLHDPAWLAQRHDIAAPLAVPVTAIHASQDGVLDWRQCLVEETQTAHNERVNSRHMTVESNPEALAVVARALARPA